MVETKRAPTKVTAAQVKALQALVETKSRLWCAWDAFEKALGVKVCKRTEADADRYLSNLVIEGRKPTRTQVLGMREVLAWEAIGKTSKEVGALTDKAIAAVQAAIRAAWSISDGGRYRRVDVEGSDDGGARSGVVVGSINDEEDD